MGHAAFVYSLTTQPAPLSATDEAIMRQIVAASGLDPAELLSLGRFAQLAGVSYRTARTWVKRGLVPATRGASGRRWSVPASVLIAWHVDAYQNAVAKQANPPKITRSGFARRRKA